MIDDKRGMFPKKEKDVSILEDMKNRNGLGDHLLKELDRELSTPPSSISEMVDRLNKSDTEINDAAIIEMFQVECRAKADQLRHQANMLRLRADELDITADKISGPILDATVKVIETATNTLRNIDETLRSHAHIKPSKLKGET